MARRAPLIHYLVNVERWIWLLIGGGGALFIGLVIALAASHARLPERLVEALSVR